MLVWGIFIAVIIFFLALDLGVFHKAPHAISTKEASIWTTIWVTLALSFSGVIYWLFSNELIANPTDLAPGEAVLKYITGYLVELSLSVDNVFVIAIIFSSFAIPQKYQHEVLYWGIIGAVVFRALVCAKKFFQRWRNKFLKRVCGSPTTLFRRSCQTTLRCFSCKGEVVNGQRKALIKIAQVCIWEVNASELLKK